VMSAWTMHMITKWLARPYAAELRTHEAGGGIRRLRFRKPNGRKLPSGTSRHETRAGNGLISVKTRGHRPVAARNLLRYGLQRVAHHIRLPQREGPQ
jgi:hypothetical protein